MNEDRARREGPGPLIALFMTLGALLWLIHLWMMVKYEKGMLLLAVWCYRQSCKTVCRVDTMLKEMDRCE